MPKKISKVGIAESYAAEAKLDKQKKDEVVSEIKIVWHDASELKSAEYNPRKHSPAQRASLREGMEKYGWQGSYCTININPERYGVIVSGHLRKDVWCNDLGNTKVPCVEGNWTLEEERELNIRLNKNGGEFDMDLLAKFFANEDLVLYGFSASELPTIDDAFAEDLPQKTIPEDPVYPIVPKFNEKYSMFCIMTTNELDETWLRNVLRISRMSSYKTNAVAPSFVISCDDFKDALQDYSDNMNPACGDNEEEVEVMQ